MRRSLLLLTTLGALLAGVVLWLTNAEDVALVAAPVVLGGARDVADDDNAAPLPAAAATEPVAAESTRVEVALTEPTAGTSMAAESKPAIVHGRFLRSDGTPAVGASASIHGWVGNSEFESEFGKPEMWTDPKGEVDAAGSLELAFDAPRAFQFMLHVKLAGFAPVGWRWQELLPGSVTDVGTVTLPWPCVIEGEIVDSQHRPSLLPWTVQADSSFKPEGNGGDASRIAVLADRTTGKFRIEGMPEGLTEIRATVQTAHAASTPVISVEVHRDEVAHARLVYDGPDVTRAIALSMRAPPFQVFGPFSPDPAHIVLTGHPAGPIAAKQTRGAEWTDLPDGVYTIAIDDPRFLPWQKTGLKPGESVVANLVGSCSVAVTVVDPRTQAAVDAYRLRVRYRKATFSPNEFVLREAKATPPPGGVYGGIIAGNDVALVVEAEGFPPTEFGLGKIEPRSARNCTVTLQAGASVRGHVVATATGLPCAGATVRLQPPSDGKQSGFSGDFFAQQQTKHLRREFVTEPDGAFVFESVVAGAYELVADVNALASTPVEKLQLAPGDVVDRTLSLPSTGSLRGHLVWKATSPPKNLRVAARLPPSAGARDQNMFRSFDATAGMAKPTVAAVDDDGGFTLDLLPAGVVELVLSLPDAFVNSPAGSFGNSGDGWVIGTATVRVGQIVDATFDLGNQHPGFARVRVTLDGVPAAALGLRAFGGADASDPTLKATANLDANGEALLGPLPPGTYHVIVAPVEPSWFATFTESFVLQPAATTSATHAITMHRGTIALVGSNGAPLPNHGVVFRTRSMTSGPFTSDADGLISVAFPEFSGAILDAATQHMSHRSTQPTYSWPPANGELRVTLEH